MIRWRISCLFLSQSGEKLKQMTWLARTLFPPDCHSRHASASRSDLLIFPAGLSLAARISYMIWLVKFSRWNVTRGTHQLQDLTGSFECLLVSWLIRSIAKVLLLRCSFENSPNIWSLHYSCRFIVSDQPDAHRVNTRSLWPWSDRPHSIVSAVCGDKNVYYKWFHDWSTRHTRKTHPYRGKRLWYLWRFKVWYFQSGV